MKHTQIWEEESMELLRHFRDWWVRTRTEETGLEEEEGFVELDPVVYERALVTARMPWPAEESKPEPSSNPISRLMTLHSGWLRRFR